MADAYLLQTVLFSGNPANERGEGGVLPDFVGMGSGGAIEKYTTDGQPSPSASISRRTLRVLLGVKPGERRVVCQVRQQDSNAARPRLMVYPNPDIGLGQFLTAVAGPSTDWQELSVNFTATAYGAVRVEFTNPDWRMCLVDELRIR